MRVYCYYFCLEPAVRKDARMRKTFVTVMVFFSKVSFWTLLDHCYVQISFSIIMRHIENNVLKDNLQSNALRTWISLRAKSFIKTSVNMKQKLMKVPGRRSVAQMSKSALRRTLHLRRSRFTYFISFFFSQT